jgi:hypothetical protein
MKNRQVSQDDHQGFSQHFWIQRHWRECGKIPVKFYSGFFLAQKIGVHI